jgi:MATE family multidrug resistance protein
LTVPEPLAFLITDQAGVVQAAVPLIFVAGCFQFGDGVQTIAQGALRGAGDTRWPLAINLVGHYVIGLPLGAGLAWGARMGAPGLWWGLAFGLSFVAVATTVRFARLSATAIARR